MHSQISRDILLVVLAALLVLVLSRPAGPVSAQSGGGYDLTWSTIDSGGAMFSTGGGYTLGGTIGQADAGVLSGGGYTLAGGFWNGGGTWRVFLPMTLK
jgi:hypothetical protein